MTPQETVGVLEVRIRGTVLADGALEECPTVYCPARQQTVPLGSCGECRDCESIGTDPRTQRVVVACRGAGSQLPPGSAADLVRVSEVMTGDVLCVAAEVGLADLAHLLLDAGVSGVPVVDHEGHPLGVISKTDLVRELYDGVGPDGEPRPEIRKTARDIMTPVAFSLREHASLAQPAALMAFECIHRVPIVSDQNVVVGVLSATDIMGWLAQRSGYIVRRQTPSR